MHTCFSSSIWHGSWSPSADNINGRDGKYIAMTDGILRENSVIVISHCECSVSEEVKLITSTQYVMSGSAPVTSRVKGGSQVRERVVFEAVIFNASTEERRPIQRT